MISKLCLDYGIFESLCAILATIYIIPSREIAMLALAMTKTVGHPHPNEHSFSAFLYTVSAYSGCALRLDSHGHFVPSE